MVENPLRRLFLLVFLTALGAWFIGTQGFRLGLDLQGGTRLVYRVDIQDAKDRGLVPKNLDDNKIMDETITVVSQRIDPNGIREASLTKAGRDRLLIELPGMSQEEAEQVENLITDLGRLEMRMVAYDDYPGTRFDLPEERKRLDKWLDSHKKLIEDDPLAIRRFNIRRGTSEGPKSKWLKWVPMFRELNPNWKPESAEPKWIWAPHSLAERHFLPINVYKDEPFFTGEDLDAKSIGQTVDPRDNSPAVSYAIVPAKADIYADWSERNKGKCSSIILNGYVRIAPVFQGRIDGQGQISGGFKVAEVQKLVLTLKTGSLKVLPELQSKASIGATLGDLAIKRGGISIIVSSILVFAFMLVYYRAAGVIAAIGLLINLALIAGGLSFMRATLTLPGLAGIVLTVGMAVDANILIFERIREEMDIGKDLKRSIEAGFEKAMSTILDANITTFLTGMILYNVGIGPIRGFAVTLMLGIVTSVFLAIYGGKLMFHYLLVKKLVKKLSMARLFTKPNLHLLRFRKFTSIISILMVVGMLTVFFTTPPKDKFGLDFTGGAAIRVALKDPMTQKAILDQMDKDPKFHKQFPSPQVTTIGDTTKDKKALEFSIKLKLTPKQREELAKEQDEARAKGKIFTLPYTEDLRRILGNKLAQDPFSNIKVAENPDGTGTIVEVTLNASRPISKEAIIKSLSQYSVNSVVVVDHKTGKVLKDAKQGRSLKLDLDMEAGISKAVIPFRIRDAIKNLKDVEGKPLHLSSPFPEESLIGSRAVGELRDAAIGAILLSLLVIILYIRVRFHEFKYGIAASIALVHDVSITLGLTVLFHSLGLIHAELDLPMIAAFLTIIGYSLNDTIVVFDRIRENLDLKKKLGGKESFIETVDMSVDQTLSRTVLTSLTTFIVVACQFIFNRGAGSVLEGFSFAMMAGIIVGTYSSIWVANPLVVWLTKWEKNKPHASSKEHPTGKHPVTAS